MLVHIFPSDYLPPPIYFVTMSHSHAQESVERPAGLSEVSQILLILSGEGTLNVRGESYRLSVGDAFYLSSGIPHEYRGDSLVSAWITFRGGATEEINKYLGRRDFVFRRGVNTAEYARRISDMEHEYFTRRSEGALSTMLYSFIISFFEEEYPSEICDMDRVVSYMEEHFSENITLDSLCEVCRMSRSGFSERFKKYFGTTAFEKLVEIRLINARHALSSNPKEKVQVIARACGFSDVSYFCKAYKKKFGTAPRRLSKARR